jgi:hypothetical protein
MHRRIAGVTITRVWSPCGLFVFVAKFRADAWTRGEPWERGDV